ncbi:Yeast-form wall Protein 1 [[Candida] zeylanoides]
MRAQRLLCAAAFAAISAAQDVACLVNGVSVATVDLQTGTCPFEIPANLPVLAEYGSSEDYDIEFYYTQIDNVRYFTDVANGGRVISVPAVKLYGLDSALFNIHHHEIPSANSTAAFRKRFQLDKRALIPQSLIDTLQAEQGTAVKLPGGPVTLSVANVTSSASGTGSSLSRPHSFGQPASTIVVSTKVITITSSSSQKCSKTTSAVAEYATTATVDGHETVYTTTCPLTSSLITKAVSTAVIVVSGKTSTTTLYPTLKTLVHVTPATVAAGSTVVAKPSTTVPVLKGTSTPEAQANVGVTTTRPQSKVTVITASGSSVVVITSTIGKSATLSGHATVKSSTVPTIVSTYAGAASNVLPSALALLLIGLANFL